MTSTDLLSAALSYADRGWRVHPLYHIRTDGSCSCGRQRCNAGKHPRFPGWQDKATTDHAQIIEWWNKHPEANIGIVCDDLVVVDVDPRNGGTLQPSFDAYPDLQAVFHSAYTVQTGDKSGDGRHYYFKGSGDFNKKRHGLGNGIEVIHGHNYVVAPPSNHVDGNQYELLTDNLTDLPPILSAVIQDGQQQSAFEGDIPEGSRNDTLARIAGSLFRDGLSLVRVSQQLHQANSLRCKPPLVHGEVQSIVDSIYKRSFSDTVSLKTHWQEHVVRSDMNDKAVHVLIALSLYADADGTNCYPNQQTLADDIRCNRQTVMKYLAQAVKDGYLNRYQLGREGQHGWSYGYTLRIS